MVQPSYAVTTYDVIGEPPVLGGAVQLTPAELSATVAVAPVGGVGTPASAEFGSTMSDDSSIAAKALAGIVFNSAISCGYGPVSQPASSVPWKNQLEPLSATMRP